MELVSIGRKEVTIPLFDTVGAQVKLHSSLTVDQQAQLMKKFGQTTDIEKQTEMSYDTIIMSFIEWNVGKDGVVLPCDSETLKQFTMRDFFAMLQACSGRVLLDAEGNILSVDEIAKKGKSA
tara:strand:+ start:223 stop:588 length:366 start_codon:yes stop_codon:yes gene_type:complete